MEAFTLLVNGSNTDGIVCFCSDGSILWHLALEWNRALIGKAKVAGVKKISCVFKFDKSHAWTIAHMDEI